MKDILETHIVNPTSADHKGGWEHLDEFLSLVEAANIVGLSAHTLAQQAAKGHLRARKIGHIWITTKNWLDEYMVLHARQNRPS